MKISIATRLRPFSHELGTTCLIPRTTWAIQAFPAYLRLYSLERVDSGEALEIALPHTGPVREFTVQQDLEKGCVWIWGIAKEGRFRLQVKASNQKVTIGERSWALAGPMIEPPPVRERLSLGSHRAQDWELVQRRLDLREFLPMLFQLSQWIPSVPAPETAMSLLCDRDWEALIRAGFFGILTPRLLDTEWQGIVPPEPLPSDASPCFLIAKAGEAIRRLFLEQRGTTISIRSPRLFDCGRMTDLQLPGIGRLDLEWAKRRPQQAILHATADTAVLFEWPASVKSCRVRMSSKDKGIRLENGAALECEQGKSYVLDRFQI